MNRYQYVGGNPIGGYDPFGNNKPDIGSPLFLAVGWVFGQISETTEIFKGYLNDLSGCPYTGDAVEAYLMFNPEIFISKFGSARNQGLYTNLRNPPTVGPGKYFTAAQKRKILAANVERNAGALRSDLSGSLLVKPQKSLKGITPAVNEAHVDHIVARSKGGENSYGNAQVLSRIENLMKGAK